MRGSKFHNISTAHDSENNVLHLQLNSKASLRELIESFSDVLRYARNRNIKKWILDLSKVAPLSEKSEYWFNTTLYPNMMIRFGPENYIGVVLPKAEYERRLKESGTQGLQTYNSYIKINTFTSPDQARQWIETCDSENTSIA